MEVFIMLKKVSVFLVFLLLIVLFLISCEITNETVLVVILSANPENGGTVRASGYEWTDEATLSFYSGDIKTIEAKPSLGWKFVGWYLDNGTEDVLLSTNSSYQISYIIGNGVCIIEGKFENDVVKYELSVNSVPPEGGNFYIPSVDNIPKNSYTGNFDCDSSIRIESEADQGYHFDGFYSGDGTLLSAQNIYNVFIDSDKTVEVRFNQQ